jgi:hypothetical protein
MMMRYDSPCDARLMENQNNGPGRGISALTVGRLASHTARTVILGHTAMKEIPLTQGKVAIVDDEDFDELNRYKWCADRGFGTWYAHRGGRTVDGVRGPKVKMHKQILVAPVGMEIDHINGDGLDNRRCNLRVATRRLNRYNVHTRNETRMGLPLGVAIIRKRSRIRFRARVGINGHDTYIGQYATPEEAGRVADEYRQKLIAELSAEIEANGKVATTT